MFTQERHRALLALLERRGRLSNGELMRSLRVSSATLRRDLADLEADRRLVRFHGGAAHPTYLRGEPSFEQRSRESVTAKRAMAEAAVALVPPGQTVFLDAGTSCLEVGRLLMTRSDLTLIANSIAFAHEARDASARIVCIGGELRGVTSALVGALALSWLDQLHAGWAFLGASGLNDDGPSTTELNEAAVKQAIIRRSENRVLVADASKWGNSSTVGFARWSHFQTWVTGPALPAKVAAQVKQQGPRVIVAHAREREPERKKKT